MKKKYIMLIILLSFILINIIWFSYSRIKYSNYIKGMDKNTFYTFIVPKYYKNDIDNFTYSVKYPDYLSLTGNLALSIPSKGNDYYQNSIIIWPKINGKYDYGVIIYDNENQYMIETDENGRALDSKYDNIISNHKENINILFKKAQENWNLK